MDRIDALRLVLDQLGVTAQELLGDDPVVPTVARTPTVGEYVDRVVIGASPGTRSVYGPYLRRVVEAWGDRRLDEPTPTEIQEFAERVRSLAVVRRNSRGGRLAAEHLIGALRYLYRRAVADGLIPAGRNPALAVEKPRRLASTRCALADERVRELGAVAGSTGNDPELDLLLLRLHIETACRRGGALALRSTDLDVDQSLIRLREKNDTVRWQPVSPTLMCRLVEHGDERAAPAGCGLLRYRSGRPITARRYDYLWQRLGRDLAWVRVQQVSMHWLRHTTLTWVERNFGYAVARAYAGHNGSRDVGVTSTYVRADVAEVAAALAALTGEPHPLAGQAGGRDRRVPLVGPFLG